MAILGASLAPVRHLAAQAANWSGALIIAPNPSPYLSDWERVPSMALLSLMYSGTAAVDFQVRVTLTSAERGLIGTTESGPLTAPGGPVNFLYNARDAVFEWQTTSRNVAVTDAAVRTGQIPEGTYRACAEVLVGTARTRVLETCAEFGILQPDPPRLLAPQDGDKVVSTQPFFQWTPVLAPPSLDLQYEITVVELLGSQVPKVALDANIPVLRTTVRTPFLLYPIDALPLERTKRYAWRVRPVDGEGRQLFRDGATSELWTFAMADDLLKPIGTIAQLPDTLVLQPGVAQLTGLRRARVARGATDVTIDGELTLEFLGALRLPSQVVRVQGLRAGLRGDGLALLEGTVSAAVPDALMPTGFRGLVEFGGLTYTPAAGVTVSARLTPPGETATPFAGALQLTPAGLYGRLDAQGPNGLPVQRVGRAPLQFDVKTVRATWPDGRLEVAGDVRVLGSAIRCPITGTVEQGDATLPVFCDGAAGVRPGGDSTQALIAMASLSGTLTARLLGDRVDGALRTTAMFRPFGADAAACAAAFTLVVDRDGVSREDEQLSCGTESKADFGWVTMRPSNLRLERLDYAPGGPFTWRALVDLVPDVPAMPQLQLPPVRDVVLDENGVHLPASSSDAPGTGTAGFAVVDSVHFLPRTMGFVGGTLSYARWLSGRDPGFAWGSGTSWISFPGISPETSSCFNAMPFEADTVVIANGRMDVTLRNRVFEPGCRLREAPNFHVRVVRVTGAVAFTLGQTARLAAMPSIEGDLVHPEPDCGVPVIGCVDAIDAFRLSGALTLTPRGRLTGTVDGFKPFYTWNTYDLRFAKLSPAGGTLTLAVSDSGAQKATYDGPVTVALGALTELSTPDTTGKTAGSTTKADSGAAGAVTGAAIGAVKGLAAGITDTVTAQATIDVIGRRLLSGRLTLTGPFKFPHGFLTFVIDRATLDANGLLVDGRQRLLVDSVRSSAQYDNYGQQTGTLYFARTDSVGVTFAGVRFDPATGAITEGAIALDGNLALESNVASTAASVVTGGTGIVGRLTRASGAFDPGNDSWLLDRAMLGKVKLALPGAPSLDARGFRVSGVAPANVVVRGSSLDSVTVTFEDGFAIEPSQSRVLSGRAQLRLKRYPIAHLDASGWHLSLGELLATAIPDTLFLPDRASAYVVLKDSTGALRVQVDTTNDGPRIRTRAGESLRLVVPALKGTRPNPPTLDVGFDLRLARGTFKPIAGELRAAVGAGTDTGAPVAGFPFTLDSLVLRAFPEREPDFRAHGRLALWGAGQAPLAVSLAVQGGGTLQADLAQPFRDTLALVPGSSRFRFGIDTLRFTAQGRLGESFSWRLDLPGHVSYVGGAGTPATRLASATFRLGPQEAALVDFVAPDSLFRIGLPGVDLLLGRFRAPTFRWDLAQQRFDFEFLFDAGLEIPALDSLRLPEIRDVRVTPQGLVIPAVELGDVSPVADPTSPFDSETDDAKALRVGGFAVRALAYRVQEFRWNWFAGAPPPSLDFGVDLEFSVEDIPSGLADRAARLTLRALDVGIRDGELSGTFERVDFPRPVRTPIADIRSAFGSFRAPDGAPADVRIALLADLRLPNLLACPSAVDGSVSLESPTDTLFLSSNGTLRGTVRNVLPSCTVALGPLEAELGTSTVRFGIDSSGTRVTAELEAAATVRVPGAQPGTTVSATGTVLVDLERGQLLDAQASLDAPFYWAPDPANPFLRLVVDRASLSRTRLAFGATGQLRTDQGAGVDVAFDSVAFDLNTNALASGRIRLTADAAVGIDLGQAGGLAFGVFPVTEPRGDAASARIVLPAGVVIDTSGVQVLGTATASLGFGGQTFAALSATFAGPFALGFAPRVAIRRGRLDLRDAAGELIAYFDSLGFWPGNLFAALPIPARLGLPDEVIAYLELRDPTDTARLLVETVVGADSVRLRTRPGERVRLVLPGLAYGGTAPAIEAQFDLLLNARTLQPISGEVAVATATGAPLLPLPNLPVDVTALAFRSDGAGYRLRADGRARLPGPLGSVALAFRELDVTADGLRGVVELGHYTGRFDPSAAPVAVAPLLGDTLSLTLTGARLTLQPGSNALALSGGLRSSLFTGAGGAARTIHLAAQADARGFLATANLEDPETPLRIGVATFTPEADVGAPAIVVEAGPQEFAVVLGGTFRLPDVAPGFSLGVRGFRIGTAGVRLPDVSISAPSATAEFELFGARFALRDSVVGATQVAPAVAVGIAGGTVRFTLSGYVTLLRNTTRFIGLRIGTDGQFALDGAQFISRPIEIIPGVARLTEASITGNALALAGDVSLPEPFAQGAPQALRLRFLPDGRVEGGGRVVLLNEPDGLATARTKVEVGLATFHLRYADLVIDAADPDGTAARLVADVYVQQKATNVLRFGGVQGSTVTPGLRIAASGQVQWSGLSMPNPIAVTLDPVTLTFRQVTSTTTGTGFTLAIGGELALAVSGGSGSLAFRDVGFTSQGELRLGEASFDGGTFTISESLRLVVGRVAWNTAPTTIWVPRAAPPAANGSVRVDSVQVTTATYVEFGATVDVAGVFTGGVDRVLAYVRDDDGTTHLLIQNLNALVPDVLEFRASLAYDERPDGFELSVGTTATLLKKYGAALVGVMRQSARGFSAGLFVNVSVEVPIVPSVVTLTGVGGGLFINPNPSDLALVKNIAGLNGPSADRLGMPPAARFAVMLYAAVDVIGSGGASAFAGRAMLTVTDQAAQLNAMGTFFKMDKQISGDLALQVGWSPAAYVRGDASLVVNIEKTLEGVASVQFFAGSNTFAVKGNVDLTVMKVVRAGAEVIIVPSGFTARLDFRASAKTSVVEVAASGLLRVWYRPGTRDLGAYLKLVGSATAFGVTAELGLTGALIVQPEVQIFALGYARVVGVELLTFEVWVQYVNGAVGAGIGANEQLNAAIARAEQVAAELEAEANQILAAIDDAQKTMARTPIAVPTASLVAAFQNFQRWNWADLIGAWGLFRLSEARTGGLLPVNASDPYVAFYERVLTNADAAADTARIAELRADAERKLQLIAARRADVEQRIAALRIQLAAAESASTFLAPADPVLTWSAGNPALVPGPPAADGTPTLRVADPPVFALDDQAAAAARTAMTDARAATLGRRDALRAQLAAVEAGLGTVVAATSASDGASLTAYAQLHSDAVEAVERLHAANVEFRMRRRAWAQGKLDTLARERGPLEQRLGARLGDIVALQQQLNATAWARLSGTAVMLDSLAWYRASFLSAWSHDPAILAEYERRAAPFRAQRLDATRALRADSLNGAARATLDSIVIAFFRTQAINYGLQDWSGVATAGLTAARDGAQAQIDSAVALAVPAVRGARDALARVTALLGDLNDRQADLHGALYDLYDGYLRTFGTADDSATAYAARRGALAQLLQAPAVSTARVTVTNFGFVSSVETSWAGTHPRGVYEHLLQEGDDSLHSVGAQGSVRRWAYSALPAGGTFARNQRVSVRGGAGFRAEQLTPYQLAFSATPLASPVTTVAVPPPDLTPPARPVVQLEGLASLVGTDGTSTLWTSDSTRLVARWSATDAESGIAEYAYRVVTYDDLASVSSVAPRAFGATLTVVKPTTLVDWTSAGGRTTVAIQGLRLPQGRRIYVQVRATNGAGLTSDVGSSPPVRLDPTPPVFAAGAALQPAPQPAPTTLKTSDRMTTIGGTPPLLPTCGTVTTSLRGGGVKGLPVWDGRLVTVTPDNGVVGGGTPARLAFTMPTATDPETGVYAYAYRVDSVAPTLPLPTDGWFDIPVATGSFVATGPTFVFGKPRWVSLVAVNAAGGRSQPLVAGPITVADATPPSAPVFCAGYAQGVIVYLTTPSTDAETGVRGYQVRVRDLSATNPMRPSAGIVRDFPAGGAVDWPASQALAGTGIRLPITVGTGGTYAVDLRAVSGTGTPGDIATSGTLLVDDTPPPMPAVSGSVFGKTATLTLTVATDPESGLGGVDIAFGTSAVEPLLGGKGTGFLAPYVTYPIAPGSNVRTIVLPDAAQSATPLYVYVRVRNGVGLSSSPAVARIR